MSTSWQSIWSRPERSVLTHGKELTLADLLDAGGWTSGAGGAVTPDAWREYAVGVGEQLGMRSGDKVFEVGCGAGALLYAMAEVWDLEVRGVDYSEPLLAMASHALPDGRFEFADVAASPLSEAIRLHASNADIVLVNSVLAYLPGLDTVDSLLSALVSGTAKCAILDVPNLHLRQEAERDRAGHLRTGDYETKYIAEGLTHLYIDPAWIQALALKNDFTCYIKEQHISGFRQSRFHFNAYLFPSQ